MSTIFFSFCFLSDLVLHHVNDLHAIGEIDGDTISSCLVHYKTM